MWWEPRSEREQEIARVLRRMNERSKDRHSSLILGIGSTSYAGELHPLLLLVSHDYPVTPARRSKWLIAGYDVGSIWRAHRYERCFVFASDVLKYGGNLSSELLKDIDAPNDTVIAFITGYEWASGNGVGIRILDDDNATLGVGFDLGTQGQRFSTAAHLWGTATSESTGQEWPHSVGVRRVNSFCFGLLKTEKPFGRRVEVPSPPSLSIKDPDIALIEPFSSVPVSSIRSAGFPTAELDALTMYGAKSGLRRGWKAGALTYGVLAEQWPHSWFAMTNARSGFANQGDSGACVHNSADELLGHLVATAGVLTPDGTTQGGIVQDFEIQRAYIERAYGIAKSAPLIAAR